MEPQLPISWNFSERASTIMSFEGSEDLGIQTASRYQSPIHHWNPVGFMYPEFRPTNIGLQGATKITSKQTWLTSKQVLNHVKQKKINTTFLNFHDLGLEELVFFSIRFARIQYNSFLKKTHHGSQPSRDPEPVRLHMVKDEVLHVIHNSTLPTSREQTPSQASG